MKKPIILILLLFVSAGLFGATIAYSLGYFSSPGAPVLFSVQKGDHFSLLASRLQAKKIITSERALRWYANWFANGHRLKRGEFQLFENMPVPEVILALTKGKPIEHKLTVPEGFNLFQIADLIEQEGLAKKQEVLAAASDPGLLAKIPENGAGVKSVEGYLYPDTYLVEKSFTAEEILQMMVDRFSEKYQRDWKTLVPESATVKGYDFHLHQVITLASIIEKETGASAERPMIASVFLNRLKKKMRLQTDPTVIYGVWMKKGDWDGNIRREDLDTPTPYNTYQISGLPPGPIANPGLSAIKAVLNPSANDFLFFVSKNDGTHVFSKNYQEHQAAVKALQVDSRARAGKSWRDLSDSAKAVNK